MIHSFNIQIAERLGVPEAIIIQNIAFWIKKNQANNKHFIDGLTWTYNSTRAFTELFPYWSEKQIYRILKSLENKGIILTANHNSVSYDRTKWYSIIDNSISIIYTINSTKMENGLNQMGKSILPNREMDSPKNGNGFSQKVEPIPDSKPDSKLQIVNQINNILSFEDFWSTYKVSKGKSKSKDKFYNLKPSQVQSIKETLHLYVRETVTEQQKAGEPFKPFRKHPLTYLNQSVWEDHEGTSDEMLALSKIFIEGGAVPFIKRDDLFGIKDFDLKKLYLIKHDKDTTFAFIKEFETNYIKEKYKL